MTKVFSIHDSKVEAYLAPFFMRAIGEAVRAFETTVNDPKSLFNQYPGDYTLFHVADYDEQSGIITPLKTFTNLGNAVEFKKTKTELHMATGIDQ